MDKETMAALGLIGSGLLILGGTVYGFIRLGRTNNIPGFPDALQNTIEKTASETTVCTIRQAVAIPYEVEKHLRCLPDGWHASAEKIATAADNGFTLLRNQTWVDTHIRGAG